MENKQSLIVPEYMQKFECIGGDCEDTCCIGFQVNLDRKTYEKYQVFDDEEFKPLLDEYIKPVTEGQTDKTYAIIDKTEDGRCAFMNDMGWCKIHMRHGSDALGLICHTYPRIVNYIDGIGEQSAGTSCPEVARLVLLNKDGIRYVEQNVDVNERHNIGINLDTVLKTRNNKQLKDNQILDYFWNIRLFAINTLQNRLYTVSDRLLILTLYFRKIDELNSNGETGAIQTLTEQYDKWVKAGVFKEQVNKLPINTEWRFNLIDKLLKDRNQFAIKNERFRERYLIALEQFEVNKSLIAEWESTLTSNYDYVFENYLVNFVFKSLFPFRGYPELIDEMTMIVFHYTMTRTFVAALAAKSPETFDEHVIVAGIQTYSKEIEQHAFYLKHVYDMMKLNDCTNIAKLSMLLKGM